MMYNGDQQISGEGYFGIKKGRCAAPTNSIVDRLVFIRNMNYGQNEVIRGYQVTIYSYLSSTKKLDNLRAINSPCS